jgi:hypothetical protein
MATCLNDTAFAFDIFYTLGLIAFPAGPITGVYLFLFLIFSAFLIILGFQFLLFIIWFFMENNKDLKG